MTSKEPLDERALERATQDVLRDRAAGVKVDPQEAHARVQRARAAADGRTAAIGRTALTVVAAVLVGTAALVMVAGGIPLGPPATPEPVGPSGPPATSGASPSGSLVAPSPTAPPSGAPAAAARLVRQYDVAPDLMAAGAGRLYGVTVSASTPGSAVLVRIDPEGTIVRQPLDDPLASYYSHLTDQGSWLYLGTSVVERFTSAANELLRIDPTTLTVSARTTLPGPDDGGLVADQANVWVALPDRVLRLDPVSLRVQASYVVPGLVPPPAGSYEITSLALGAGSLWVTVPTSATTTAIDRLDPTSLTLRSRTIADGGADGRVAADADAVWFTTPDTVATVDATGQVADPVTISQLQSAAAQGHGLLALVPGGASAETLLQLDARGIVVGSTDVGDAGAPDPIPIDGSDVWLLQGTAVAHWTLVAPQP